MYLQEYLVESVMEYTVLETSLFYDNFATGLLSQKLEDGSEIVSLNAGSKPHPACAVADIGASAACVALSHVPFKASEFS